MPVLLLAFLCLTGCKLHDNYTGEPFIRVEYTVDGKHYEYEDWGKLGPGYLFMKESFEPLSGGGLSTIYVDEQSSVARFLISNEFLFLNLESPDKDFIDGRKYEITPFLFQEPSPSHFTVPAKANVTSGWFSLHRKTVEPYCVYDVRFEFHCKGPNAEYDVTEGIVQVGRRFQRASAVDKLIYQY